MQARVVSTPLPELEGVHENALVGMRGLLKERTCQLLLSQVFMTDKQARSRPSKEIL